LILLAYTVARLLSLRGTPSKSPKKHSKKRSEASKDTPKQKKACFEEVLTHKGPNKEDLYAEKKERSLMLLKIAWRMMKLKIAWWRMIQSLVSLRAAITVTHS
jgi:hypothetical protein